jgi:hypothetical protein
MVLRRFIRSPASPSRGAWLVEETFKTGRDLLAWNQFQAKIFGAICRHTTLTALVGTSTCPPPPAPGQSNINAADLQSYSRGAPLPGSAGQPCRALPAPAKRKEVKW